MSSNNVTENERDSASRYELTFLIREDDPRPVAGAVVEVGGSVVETFPATKVQLEYPIQKERFAFLGVIVCDVPHDGLQRLDRALRLQPSVLRHLVTKPIVPKRAPRPGTGTLGVPPGVREEARPGDYARRRIEPIQELTNEALERKIEEILQ